MPELVDVSIEIESADSLLCDYTIWLKDYNIGIPANKEDSIQLILERIKELQEIL